MPKVDICPNEKPKAFPLYTTGNLANLVSKQNNINSSSEDPNIFTSKLFGGIVDSASDNHSPQADISPLGKASPFSVNSSFKTNQNANFNKDESYSKFAAAPPSFGKGKITEGKLKILIVDDDGMI